MARRPARPARPREFAHNESLSSDSIRLLRPLDHELRFEVVVVARIEAPPYAAVSYTWGDEEASRKIELDGRKFPVRKNLLTCLHHLAWLSLYEDSRPSFLWVDAICINQSDERERNAQVGQMDRTYHDAQYVCVWLGPSVVEGPMEWCDWENNILDLARRPYWSRFWVIQEFLLSKDVEVNCGGSSMRLADFTKIAYKAANFWQPHATIRELWDYLDGAIDLFPMLTLVMGRMGTLYHESQSPQSLQELLVTHRRSQCNDPRDRVFALLGLISHEERQMLDRSFPDYSLSEYDVQLITLKHIARRAGGEVDAMPWDKLFVGLGVTSERHQRRLREEATRRNHTGRTVTDRERGRSGGRRRVNGRPKDKRNHQRFPPGPYLGVPGPEDMGPEDIWVDPYGGLSKGALPGPEDELVDPYGELRMVEELGALPRPEDELSYL